MEKNLAPKEETIVEVGPCRIATGEPRRARPWRSPVCRRLRLLMVVTRWVVGSVLMGKLQAVAGSSDCVCEG